MNSNRIANATLLAALALCVAGAGRSQSTPPQQDKTTKIQEVDARSTQTYSGDELFKEYCAVCHGTGGKGDGPAAEALKKRPADLTQLSRKNGGKFPALEVKNYISGMDTVAAHGSRAMPIWGDIFSQMPPGRKDMATFRMTSLIKYIEQMQAN
jgi:mono/diheme cytochrome c family protein